MAMQGGVVADVWYLTLVFLDIIYHYCLLVIFSCIYIDLLSMIK